MKFIQIVGVSVVGFLVGCSTTKGPVAKKSNSSVLRTVVHTYPNKSPNNQALKAFWNELEGLEQQIERVSYSPHSHLQGFVDAQQICDKYLIQTDVSWSLAERSLIEGCRGHFEKLHAQSMVKQELDELLSTLQAASKKPYRQVDIYEDICTRLDVYARHKVWSFPESQLILAERQKLFAAKTTLLRSISDFEKVAREEELQSQRAFVNNEAKRDVRSAKSLYKEGSGWVNDKEKVLYKAYAQAARPSKDSMVDSPIRDAASNIMHDVLERLSKSERLQAKGWNVPMPYSRLPQFPRWSDDRVKGFVAEQWRKSDDFQPPPDEIRQPEIDVYGGALDA